MKPHKFYIWTRECNYVTTLTINHKNRVNIKAGHIDHQQAFRKLNRIVLPSDVPDMQFYYRMAGYFKLDDLSALMIPIVGTQAYTQRQQYHAHVHAYGKGNPVKYWSRWCSAAVLDVLKDMKYDDLIGKLQPFEDFLIIIATATHIERKYP